MLKNIICLYILTMLLSKSICDTTKYRIYKKLSIENYNLCSEVATRKIELKRDREEALHVIQTSTKNHNADWALNKDCKFEVKSDSGLFAVIQKMNFRQNETTGKCIDYVQFETRQPTYSPKLCGHWNIIDFREGILENTNFVHIELDGKIETKIFISKERWKEDETMDLQIVYTKFKRCDEKYFPCIDANSKLCINKEFFNDSLVNCPFANCQDEGNCQLLYQQQMEMDICGEEGCINSLDVGSDSTKLILSAVTSLVISFVVFIVCIYVCKKTGTVCWSANCTESTRSDRRPQSSRVIEMENRSVNQPATTEPPVATAPEPDKDLPPSYESLFPSR